MYEDEFPHQPGLIYLNHAGVGPWPRRARDAAVRFAEMNVSRGAADYPQWLEAEGRLRERAARLTGAESTDEIALVKNTSEGLSMVAYGLDWQPGDNVVVSDQEFPSNRIPWESLAERFGVEVRRVRLADGTTPEDALIAAMDRRTRVLPVSAVQWASGLRMDLERLGGACREHDALFCVDAIQLLGAASLSAQAIGADIVVADGHKWMLGPEGIGIMYLSPRAMERLQLLQYGWHMVRHLGDHERTEWEPASSARRFEAGSPNTLGAHALEASLSLLEEVGMARVEALIRERARHLLDRIAREPRLTAVTPDADDRHLGIVTFRVRGADPEQLLRALRNNGIYPAARAGGLRFSPHFYTEPHALDSAVDAVLALG
jgi:selenocysteine lyase/cysteine desulfurase